MNRFMALVLVALLTFVAVLWVKRPEVISNLWLWLIGLSGPIIALGKRLFEEGRRMFPFKNTPKTNTSGSNATTLVNSQIPK
jgi:hypothetical protein